MENIKTQELSSSDYEKFSAEAGFSPKYAKWLEREIELAEDVNGLIESISNVPEERRQNCDFWYELVVACYNYKKHWDKQYRKGGIK